MGVSIVVPVDAPDLSVCVDCLTNLENEDALLNRRLVSIAASRIDNAARKGEDLRRRSVVFAFAGSSDSAVAVKQTRDYIELVGSWWGG